MISKPILPCSLLRYFLPDTSPEHGDFAYSVSSPNCFHAFVLGHEFGHNFGCTHNREDSPSDMEYAHGYRYCPEDAIT